MQAYLKKQSESVGLSLTDEQTKKVEQYHDLLVEANRVMNLTRVPDEMEEAVDRNYLDSMAPVALGLFDGAETVVDVGSGAGFPGVPLAIALPDKRFTLMDSLTKRVEFLKSVVSALSLNAEAVALRAEDAGRKAEYREQFDLAVSRAVAPVNVLAELMLPLLRVGGRMLAYKGPAVEEEAKEAEKALELLGGRVRTVHEVRIPGRDWRHTVLEIEKIAPTPEKYPRRAGMPEKKPLV